MSTARAQLSEKIEIVVFFIDVLGLSLLLLFSHNSNKFQIIIIRSSNRERYNNRQHACRKLDALY